MVSTPEALEKLIVFQIGKLNTVIRKAGIKPERTAKAGIAYSPHNPTGPVCTFASLHLCALAPNFLILERQSETSIYDDIIVGSHPSLVNGCYAIPERPGLGIDLNPEVITAHPYKPPSVESLSDPRLG